MKKHLLSTVNQGCCVFEYIVVSICNEETFVVYRDSEYFSISKRASAKKEHLLSTVNQGF